MTYSGGTEQSAPRLRRPSFLQAREVEQPSHSGGARPLRSSEPRAALLSLTREAPACPPGCTAPATLTFPLSLQAPGSAVLSSVQRLYISVSRQIFFSKSVLHFPDLAQTERQQSLPRSLSRPRARLIPPQSLRSRCSPVGFTCPRVILLFCVISCLLSASLPKLQTLQTKRWFLVLLTTVSVVLTDASVNPSGLSGSYMTSRRSAHPIQQ